MIWTKKCICGNEIEVGKQVVDKEGKKYCSERCKEESKKMKMRIPTEEKIKKLERRITILSVFIITLCLLLTFNTYNDYQRTKNIGSLIDVVDKDATNLRHLVDILQVVAVNDDLQAKILSRLVSEVFG